MPPGRVFHVPNHQKPEFGTRQAGRTLQESGCERLREAGLQPDYLAICNAVTLEPAREDDSSLVILAAVFLGRARLIDNVRVSLK